MVCKIDREKYKIGSLGALGSLICGKETKLVFFITLLDKVTFVNKCLSPNLYRVPKLMKKLRFVDFYTK